MGYPLHPQHQAEAARNVWKDLWAPTQLPEPEGFEQLRQLVAPTAEYPLPTVTRAALFARFKATLKRSTGLDGKQTPRPFCSLCLVVSAAYCTQPLFFDARRLQRKAISFDACVCGAFGSFGEARYLRLLC